MYSRYLRCDKPPMIKIYYKGDKMEDKYGFDFKNNCLIKEGAFWLNGENPTDILKICEELNTLYEEIDRQEERIKVKKEQLSSLKELNSLLFDVIDGMLAYKKLQDLGYYFDDD